MNKYDFIDLVQQIIKVSILASLYENQLIDL